MQDSLSLRWRWLLGAAVALLAFALALRPVDNFDLGFILRIGERVARAGIPVTDPFSWPGEGQRWALEQWLGPLAFYGAFAAGGIAGVIVFKALVCAGAMLLAFFAARTASGSAIAAALAAMLGAAAAAARFNAQPNVLSLVGVGLVSLALHRALAARSLRPALLLPLVFAVWVHVHPGYFSGLVLLGAFCAGVLLDLLAGTPRFSLRQALGLCALSLACAGAGVLSLALFHPLGLAPLARVLQIFFSDVSRANITEYAPLTRSYALSPPILLLLAAPPLCWALARRLQLALAVPWLAFAAGELRVGRLLAEASIVLVPLFAHAAVLALTALRERGHVRAVDPARLAWLPIAAALAGSAAQLPFVGLDWPEPLYPRDCYEWIDAHNLPARGFNDLWFGGSFIFHFDGRRKTFIDGRSFYSDAFFTDAYLPIKNAAPGWQEVTRKWGIEWFLLVPGRFRALHQALPGAGFHLAYEDPYCTVYVR